MSGLVDSQHGEMAAHDDSWILDQLQLEALGKRGGEQIIEAKLMSCSPGVDGRSGAIDFAATLASRGSFNSSRERPILHRCLIRG